MSWFLVGTIPGPGGGSPGSATITDSLGKLEVSVTQPETNPTPVDISQSDLDLLYAEINAALSETAEFQTYITDNEAANPIPDETQTLDLAHADEVNLIPTETNLSELTQTSVETNPTPTETNLSELSATDAETNPTPSETNLSEISRTDAETNALPTETNLSEISQTDAETNALPSETQTAELVVAAEVNPTPTETNLSELSATDAETNPTPTEASLSFELGQAAEVNPTPTETNLSELSATDAETNPTPTEASLGFELLVVDEPNPTPTETNLSEISQTDAETNALPSATDMVDLNHAAEANPTPTETQTVELLPPDEPNPTPTETNTADVSYAAEANAPPTATDTLDLNPAAEANPLSAPDRSLALRVGATTVTQTVGTGWVSPANSQGLNDSTNATITGPAGALPATITGTLVGVFSTAGAQTGETLSGVVTLTFWRTVVKSTLGVVSFEAAYSTDSGTNYTIHETVVDNAPGPDTNLTITIPIANLANLRFRVVASVKGDVTANSSATLDAVVASYSTSVQTG